MRHCPTRRLTLFTTLTVLALVSMSCSSADTANSSDSKTSSTSTPAVDPTEPTPTGTFKVGRTQRTYVDDSRPTVAHGGAPEVPSRALDTLVLYPAISKGSNTEPLDGPWPLIVFSHGSTRAGIDYIDTLSQWVSAGYVVVAPSFPLSKTGTPGGTNYGDYESQTKDVSFIIDSATTDTEPLGPTGQTEKSERSLSKVINADHIGLGGQSFGAITTLGSVAAKCCADDRVDVATEFAGVWLPFSTGSELAPTVSSTPVLFVHGSEDPTLPYAGGRSAWEMISAPGGFLTLVGTGHDDGFFGGDSTPLDNLVSQATLAFYDSALKGDKSGLSRIESLVAKAGPKVATFEPTP